MSNTKIQIRRSAVTATPVDGSLSAGEQAYSYLSNRLFIGTSNGNSIMEIGGRYWLDQTINAYNQANTGSDVGTSAFDKANTANLLAYDVSVGANAYATSVGTAGNNYTNYVGTAGNAYATFVGTSANNYASDTYYAKSGGTVSGDMVVTGNLTVSGTTTYANTQHLYVGDSLFTLNADLPSSSGPSENAGMEVNRGSSANVAVLWNESFQKWTLTNDGTSYYNIATNTDISSAKTELYGWANTVGSSANSYSGNLAASGNAHSEYLATSANAYSQYLATSANLYSASVGFAANTNAANGSYITQGTISVIVGGTGRSAFTQYGVIYGNDSGQLLNTSAGVEGQVLQADASGIPSFGMLDGGSF